MKIQNLIFSILSLVTLVALLTGGYDKTFYNGPAATNFDGKKFFYLNKQQNSVYDFLKWQLTQDQSTWPEWVKAENTVPPQKNISGNNLRITLVGHSTFLIQTNDYNILTDPVWSSKLGPYNLGHNRISEPGIKFDDLPPIDIVLISHNHYDHLDLPTIEKLVEKFSPVIIAPLGVTKAYLENIKFCKCHEIDWWEELYLKENLKVALTPALHWSQRSIFDKNSTLWGGFMLSTGAGNIYFAGDTGFGDGSLFKQIKAKYPKIKLALLPIGAYLPRWFMAPEHASPQEAVQIFQILKPQYAAAMHYNTFNLADDSYNQAVDELNNTLNTAKISQNNFRILSFGQPWDVK